MNTPKKQCWSGDSCVHPEGPLLPETTEYFRPGRGGRLRSKCRACEREYDRNYREKNREVKNQRTRDWRAKNPAKSKQSAANWRKNNPEEFKQAIRNWRLNNLEYARAYDKAYYWNNRDRKLANNREYLRKNPRAYVYNAERDKVYVQRRRTMKRKLPFLWGRAQRREMMEYWGYKCAICGEGVGFWHTLAEDHWIALSDPRSDNPGTVPWNVLPLCHTKKGGQGSCNQSKTDKDPVQWLINRFGERAARKKLAEIERYFQSMKAKYEPT